MSISITARFGGVPLLTAAFFGAGVALFGTAANASNVHLKPPNSSPSFIDNGITLTASGALAGLGNEDVIVNLGATGLIAEFCVIGGGQPQRQEPAPASVAASGAIQASEVKNGNTTFMVTTPPPPPPDCGPGATGGIASVSFTSATITVQQGEPPATVLTVSCMFNPPTSDGDVPPQTVTCSSE
jgi:hypothetical protein